MGLGTSTAVGLGLIPGQGTKILKVKWLGHTHTHKIDGKATLFPLFTYVTGAYGAVNQRAQRCTFSSLGIHTPPPLSPYF